MPSGIDVMVWNDDDSKEIVATPVSVPGRKFLRALTGDEHTQVVVMCVGVDEFLSHVPPNLKIYFNRDDGVLVQMGIKNCLQ